MFWNKKARKEKPLSKESKRKQEWAISNYYKEKRERNADESQRKNK
jgi:hypothetical protein